MAKFKKLALLCSAILMTTSLAVGIAACEEEHVHTYGTTWSKDETNHWYGCTDATCTLEIGKAAHEWNEGEVTTAPTETDTGVKTYTCVVCDATKTESVAALGHVHTAATVWSKDATQHWHACTNGTTCTEKLDAAAHTWDEGTVTTPATEDAEGVTTYTCTVEGCGATKTEAIAKLNHVHTYGTTWSSNETKHWYGCTKTTCTTGKVGEADHKWDDGEEVVSPTEEAFGTMVYTCVVCSYEKEEPIDKLTPDPLRVTKGTVTAKDSFMSTDETVTLPETGSYIITWDKGNVSIGFNTGYAYMGAMQFDAVKGDTTISFSYGDKYDDSDVEISYEIKKVPSVTVTTAGYTGEIEATANAWVRVAFTMAETGRYMLTADDVVFTEDQENPSYSWLSGEKVYVFTAEANEVLTLLAKVESDEATATVSYEVAKLTAQDLEVGDNQVYMVGNGIYTEVAFKAPAAGTYHFETYDDTLVVYTDENRTLASKANGYYFFDAEADETVTFFLYSYANYATFEISEFTDEERYSSSITATFAENENETTVTANIKAGTSASLDMAGGYVVEWDNESITFAYDGATASTQSVYYGYGMQEMRGMTSFPTFTNATEEDIEFTITLKKISDTNPLDGTVEIIVRSSAEIPVKLDEKSYEMSISNAATTLTVVYGFDFNDTTAGTVLTTTAQKVSATGEVEILYIQNNDVDTTTYATKTTTTMFTVAEPLVLGSNTLAINATKTFTADDATALYAIVNIQASFAGLSYTHPMLGTANIDSSAPHVFQNSITLTAQGSPYASDVSFEIVKLTTLTTGDNAVDVAIKNYYAAPVYCAFAETGSYTIALADGEETADITLWVMNPMLGALQAVDLSEYPDGFTFEATGDPIVISVCTTANPLTTTSDTINFTITEVTA